ncbi:MAG: two-component regulator propeller domain-containing protein [Verrucomicrobiota bacterium]
MAFGPSSAKPWCRFPISPEVAPGHGDGFWISDGSGVRRLKGSTLSPPVGPTSWQGRNLRFGIEDHAGNLWLATDGNGILCYPAQGTFRRLDVRDGLCGDYASCLFVDRQGNVWVGSDGGGLSRVSPALFGVAGRSEGLTSDRVTALLAGPAGALWIGTHGDGLNYYDGRNFSPVAGFPPTGRVTALAGNDGDLWIGTSGGLLRRQAGKFQTVGGWPRAGAPVIALHRDRRGDLWIGQRTTGTVAVMRGGQAHEVKLGDPRPETEVKAFAEDADGRIWIGTDGAGLFAWQGGKVVRVGEFTVVHVIACGAGGIVWVATDEGLVRIEPVGKDGWRCERGWADGVFHALAMDGPGSLWATDESGLCRLHVEEEVKPARVTSFGKGDGLPGLQAAAYGSPQSAHSGDGRLWFATTAGVVMANPSREFANEKCPPVLIEELRVNGATRWTPASSSVPTFHSGDRGFDFKFTAINLRHPEQLSFVTRIDGVDRDWRELRGAHSVFHATLPPGGHLFRVKVRDRSGRWSDEQQLAFRILPPLWQRGWFIVTISALAIAFAASLAWLAGRWRIRRQLDRIKLEQAVANERARIARDLHDQLGSGLTEIAFLGDALRMDAGPAATDAAEVSSRARELTRAMDETVWALEPRNDNLESLISYLSHAVPGWLRSSGLRCRLDLPDESLRFGLTTRVRQQLYLACKEAVHNAVKHSRASELSLGVKKDAGELVITIQDNGCGFDPTTVPPGNGLANLRERLTDLGGGATIDSVPGRGTAVVFRLPLPT